MMRKSIKSKLMLMMMILVLAVGATGCGKKDTKVDGTKGDKKEIVIGLSMNTLNNPFFVDVKEGAEKAAKDNNVKIIVTDAQNESSKQVTDIENLVQKKPDLIIIDPTDSDAIVAGIETANENKIPVITVDREANGGEVISHLGFNAIKSGNIAGEYLVKELEGKGKIVEIQGILGTNVAQDRSKGFNEIIKKNKDMEVVSQQSANFDRAEAMKVMENILQANPKIDGVYAANDEMVLGALEAIEGAGRLDEITIIGCDSIDPAIEALKAGKLNATISEPPFYLGKTAVETGLKYLDGKKVEKNVILFSTLVTEENVNDISTRD